MCAVLTDLSGNCHQFPEVSPLFIFSPTALFSNYLSLCLEEYLDPRSPCSNSKTGCAVCLGFTLFERFLENRYGISIAHYLDKSYDMLIRCYTLLTFLIYLYYTTYLELGEMILLGEAVESEHKLI